MNSRWITLAICFLSFLLFESNSVTAQYAIGETTITFVDASRGNRNISCLVYYPATSAGTNAPIAGGGATEFPVFVYGHGFTIDPGVYTQLSNTLTPKGYIMVLPETETSFSPSHGDFGADLLFAVNGMQAEGADPASQFFGVIKNKTAVGGHSMGGGSSFLAAENDPPNVTTLVNMAAAETTPSAIAAAANITIPTLVIAGGEDCVAPVGDHQKPMYDASAASCKVYYEIDGAAHCRFSDGGATSCFAAEGFTCAFGWGPFLNQADQNARVDDVLVPWLDYYLMEDCDAYALVQSALATHGGMNSVDGCPTPPPCTNVSAPGVELEVKVALEGPFDGSAMSTNLSVSGLMPLSQPYNAAPWNYVGSESIASYPANAVDWVIVELRSSRAGAADESKAAILTADGTVLDVDGTPQLKFSTVLPGDYYVVVRHKGHVDVMSGQVLSLSAAAASYDFTSAVTQAYGTNQQLLIGGSACMLAGDFDGNGVVTFADFNAYLGSSSEILFYNNWEVDFDGHVTVADYNLYKKNASAIGVPEIQL